MSLPVIIDTDPGIDDAMAILYAVAEPEIDLLGLTTVFGNVSLAEATRNARGLLALAGGDGGITGAGGVPVVPGAERPRVRPLNPFAYHVHGPTGLGTTLLPAPSAPTVGGAVSAFLADRCAERPGEITIIALGPLTNLAQALDERPALAERVGRLVVMGGAVRGPGNITPHAEYNFWQDPEAAARVLGAGWPITLVGLDVTTRVVLTPDRLGRIARAAPRCGGFLAEAVTHYFSFHAENLDLDGCHFHDPTAVIASAAPKLLRTEALRLSVTVDGPEGGRVRETPEGCGPVDVCLEVDAEAVLDRFVSTLSSGRLP